jgi:hypothetical protein
MMLLLMVALVSCEYNFINPDKGEPVDPEVPISFSEEVEPIFGSQSCTNCHNGSNQFSLLTGDAYNSLMTNNLVDEETPENSKILTVPGSPSIHTNWNYEGNQREIIKVWIEQGAKDN